MKKLAHNLKISKILMYKSIVYTILYYFFYISEIIETLAQFLYKKYKNVLTHLGDASSTLRNQQRCDREINDLSEHQY